MTDHVPEKKFVTDYRRHHRVNHGRPIRTQAPSQLSNLDGSRSSGGTVRHYATTKAPKRRFEIGDKFRYDGETWELIYMYRLKSSPGVWFHCLEVRTESKSLTTNMIGQAFETLGAGATTPRVVFSEFPDWQEANSYFRDIYAHGSRTHKNTQQLLNMKKL